MKKFTKDDLCPFCGERPVEKHHEGYYRGICWKCRRPQYAIRAWGPTRSMRFKMHVGKCTRCGFIPEVLGQLDIHHRNGDHSDNRRPNWEVLCANCHRLVTYKERTAHGQPA